MAASDDVTRVPFTEREETGGETWEGKIKNWDWPYIERLASFF